MADAEQTKQQKLPLLKRTSVRIALVAVVLATVAAAVCLGLWGAGVFSSNTSAQSTEAQVNSGSGAQQGSPGTNTGSPTGTGAATTTTVQPEGYVFGYKYTYPQNVDASKFRPNYTEFQRLVPAWSEWKAKCGNGKCEEGEWCKTCPQDCKCTVNCGNGQCDDGEDGATCPQDCTHIVSVCGNGKCENNYAQRADFIHNDENEYNCPQDCKLDHVCGNGKCENTESCWTCPGDCGKCPSVCGDGACDANETCASCHKDCGLCDPKDGDGRCDWPRETPEKNAADCATAASLSSFKYNGIEYATLDNAPGAATTTSCFTAKELPKGWMLAVYDENARGMLKALPANQFSTSCLMFEDGTNMPTGNTNKNQCPDKYLDVVVTNGVRTYRTFQTMDDKGRVQDTTCSSRILLQNIASTLTHTANKRKCPNDCSGHGACDVISGRCECSGRWTGPGCERVIGDFQVPATVNDWFKPKAGIPWQWQLTGEIDEKIDVPLYDVDFDTPASVIASLKAKGRKVMCYHSAGSYENFRRDAKDFLLQYAGGHLNFGKGDDFMGEAWLDLKRMDVFGGIMLQRLDEARGKGCDAMEWDNPDMIIHEHNLANGGQVDLSIQLMFNKWLVAQTHARGMGVALKNSNEFASYLWETYDMVVNEECWINGNCGNYWPFINADKPVLNTEYFTARCMYCDRANKMKFSTIKKRPELDACRVSCEVGTNGTKPWNTAPCVAAGWPKSYFEGGQWCEMTRNTLPDECPAKRFTGCSNKNGL